MASKVEGAFMVWSVIFAESYHEHVSPIREFVARPDGLVPVAITESGNGMIFAPMDQLLWTEGVETAVVDIAGLMDEHGGGKEHAVWIDGEFSPLALKNLESKGWVAIPKAFEKLAAISEK
jgi:hypothetical protein